MNSVTIVGAACRLPGAPDEASFREVLNRGLFTVGELPADRWYRDLLFHPDPRARGSAYTFAGGFLPTPYDFDIGVFGMSPREAMQLDPQQRLLAEVVWEALEDARIAPSTLAGKEVGVYIGVSALDHANLFGGDPTAIESHFMTGNTLSIVANRISYLFDLKGPSLVIDTACSASLVAVDRAVADLRSGRIDTAIVGGVNMLLSPAAFVGFSRAAMLSPTGACRPFSDQADGYVRSEGAVVFVLQRHDIAVPGSVRALVAGTAVNSDGRTSGIALPGFAGQRALLDRAYSDAGVAPDELAFIEAHGTGTVVGDPIEAAAIGEVLGRKRSRPLPIGSVKSNIGHLEPASGVAGMMKALIAMEQRRLPATLHLRELNPHISFDALNLHPAAQSVALDKGPLHCGISSFGFGGTNAHVILSSPPTSRRRVAASQDAPDMLVLSAHCREALSELAASCADRLDAGADPARFAGAINSGRELMRRRAVMPVGDAATMAASLRDFAATERNDRVTVGNALATAPVVCFVYNGNGSQWAGMGRAAYSANLAFAEAFRAADAKFSDLGFESLVDVLHADDLADRLGCAAIAQPLIFAIQIGVTTALADRGLRAAHVLGHSVGEVAAAHVAGILDLEQSARILSARAHSQESIRGLGGMAAVAADRAAVGRLIGELNLPQLCIAADNAPGSVTVAGCSESLAAFLAEARRRRIASRKLDVDYPYHSPMLDEIRVRFLAEAGILSVRRPIIPMVSTVTGQPVAGRRLESPYWWENIRNEVLFRRAVRTVAECGANLFVEIGPRSVLASSITGSLEEAGLPARTLSSLSETDPADADPIAAIFARAVANGFAPTASGRGRKAIVDRSIDLPRYPWQRHTYRYAPGTSAIDIHGTNPRHPLIGARIAQGVPEWRTVLDPKLVPYLADHILGGEVVVPATALTEMALAVARELWPEGAVCVEDLDIVQAMVLPTDGQREVSVRYSELSTSIEIYSRPRFGGDEWTLCAHGRIAPAEACRTPAPTLIEAQVVHDDADEIYRTAASCGLDYGPTFRLLERVRRDEEVIEVSLAPAVNAAGHFTRPQVLHPATLDAAFHGLFDMIDGDDGKTWLPIRFERVSVWRDDAQVTDATVVVDKSGDQLKTVSVWLQNAEGATVARLDRALLRAVTLSPKRQIQRLFHLAVRPAGQTIASSHLPERAKAYFLRCGVPQEFEGRVLLRAHMRAVAYEVLRGLAGSNYVLDVAQVAGNGQLAMLSGELAAAGLASDKGGRITLSAESNLPQSDLVLTTVAADCPQASTDLALSAHAAATLSRTLSEGIVIPPRPALIDRHDSASFQVRQGCEALLACLTELLADSPARRLHVVVAEPNGSAIVGELREQAVAGKLRLSIAVENAAARERLSRRLPLSPNVEIVDLSLGQIPCADIAMMLCVTQHGSAHLPWLSGLAQLLRPGGVLLAAELREDSLTVFQRGAREVAAGDTRMLAAQLAATGILQDTTVFGSAGEGLLVHVCARSFAATRKATALCVGPPSSRTTAALTSLAVALEAENVGCAILDGMLGAPSARLADNILYLINDIDEGELVDVLDALARLFAGLQKGRDNPTLWIVAMAGEAIVQAVRGFVRVAMNERSDRDIRLVEIAAGTSMTAAAAEFACLLAQPGGELEVIFGVEGQDVPRVLPGMALQASDAAAHSVVLDFPRPGMLENFRWSQVERQTPGLYEIEVEIAATGLNFRDVMLAMGLLGDDVLDEGMAGAVYGLECAGRVVAVGAEVTAHKCGDLVLGFGNNSFSTHVVAPESSFAAVPSGLSLEVAAGIPVAFCTAWHALIDQARLAPGERVLIHGGAGAVGLAAIQIARHIGAEVIATVSSCDKEAIARLYGASYVYDSRSLAFADAVRDRHSGVDVVVNSLSADAMRASIKCLRSRGRFVELGKRDYVANSLIGLRPFRRNLSYFGVDLDQLLALEPELVSEGLRAVLAGFASGAFLPLPTMTHRASEMGEAFRLMQSAGHVGKIVVSPPSRGAVAERVAQPFEPGEGVQLVVGGTRGFGLATALWLAERGAGRIVVASRSGKLDASQYQTIESLRERGVTFAVERVDVSQRSDVEALVGRVATAHGPITGVYHAAVVLRDGLIESLSKRALSDVLAPKVAGAENLDAATRGQPVKHFVVYSSASAFIGNPGQAAYAAANGYVEGLVRRRRGQGLPGLAVAWGAISDVGLLAGQTETIESLSRVAGVVAMRSEDALEELGKILVMADHLTDPVVTCAEFASGGALQTLATPSSPAFAALFAARGVTAVEAGGGLAEMVAGKSDGEAHRIVAQVVVEEVAQILRLAVQDVDLDASIDSLGMDSLMALELRMSIESKHRIDLPVMSISAVHSLRELAHRVLMALRQEEMDDVDGALFSDAEAALIDIHGGTAAGSRVSEAKANSGSNH